jgi:DNA-binding MarR family transcriptional regulator
MDTQPQLDDARNSLWRLFLTAQVKLLDRIEARFSNAGLPPMEWYDVLLTLKQAPDHRVRLSDLADQVLLSRSNLTRLVDRLEKAELLRREPCPSDRRGTFAVLTEAGLAMQQKMWVVYAQEIAELFGKHLNNQELKVMQRVLNRMLAAEFQTKMN